MQNQKTSIVKAYLFGKPVGRFQGPEGLLLENNAELKEDAIALINETCSDEGLPAYNQEKLREKLVLMVVYV